MLHVLLSQLSHLKAAPLKGQSSKHIFIKIIQCLNESQSNNIRADNNKHARKLDPPLKPQNLGHVYILLHCRSIQKRFPYVCSVGFVAVNMKT